jgi:hypothetical protein
VETVPGDDLHTATAKLSLKETQPGNTPDYETFDTLYIQLTVTDKNTTEGDGTDSGREFSSKSVQYAVHIFSSDCYQHPRCERQQADIC